MPAKKKARCLAPGCDRGGDFCRGFCAIHYHAWRAHRVANGNPARGADDIVVPERPRWEWPGDAQALIAQYGEKSDEQ